MKKTYLSSHASGPLSRLWVLLVMLLAVPLWGQAQVISVTPNNQNFGQVKVGEVSAPATFTFSGTDQTAITVSFANAPSFEGSTNGTTFSQNPITLPASGGTIQIRFRPTRVGPTAADPNAEYVVGSKGRNQNQQAFIDLFGTGTAGDPLITVSPTALGFGNQIINTTSMPMSVTAAATSLTAPLVVTAPTGFLVSTTSNGTYTQSLNLTPAADGSVNTTVFVVFAPTAAQNYVDGVSFASTGATTRTVNVSGTGVLPAASLSATPTSLDFGTLQAGQVSTPQSFTVTGDNVTTSVMVTAPTGYLIRVGTTGAYSQSVTLFPSNNEVNSTLQAIFSPSTAGTFTGNITANTTGNGGATATVSVTGTATPQPTGPFIAVNPSSLDFGTVSATGSAQTLTFTISAGNLTDPLVLTGSNNNIVFRDASAGGSFTNGPLVIAPSGGTVSTRTIEVQLTGPIASGPFSGNITASSTGATSQTVTITANSTGNNSVINASGNLSLFSTVPGVPSDVQSYTLSGSNLLQDITVAAPQYFQVSTDANFTGISGTGNTIIVARNSGSDVTATTIYVRFIPSDARTVSSLVLNSSAPAVRQGIPVAGTSEPTIQIANAFQEVSLVVLNTTSASQTLTINAQRVLQPVTISKLLATNPLNTGNTPQFELSLDNVTFTNSVTLTPNTTTYTINQQIYVRYKPTYLGLAQSTLQFQSNDFANKSVQAFGANDLLSGRSIDIEPTQRSSATVTRNGNTATVTFNLPANYAQLGYGEGRLIVASTNPTLPGNNQPLDGNSYQTGNQTYGQGPQIAPGYFSVYAGANQTVTVDGLDLATTYYFYTFEYNNIDNGVGGNTSVIGAENYLSPPVPSTIPGIIAPSPLPVTLVSFSAKVKNNQVALTWETAAELNNKHFEVQRSRDGRSFETVLIREGKGTTSSRTIYNEVDKKPLNGVSYYRLKQVDLDGSSSFSSLVAVSFLNSGDVTMYPNPVEDQLTIELGGSSEGVTAVVTDMTGRVISTQKLGADSKLNMSSLQTGTYLVTVGEGTAKVTRRIVKK